MHSYYIYILNNGLLLFFKQDELNLPCSSCTDARNACFKIYCFVYDACWRSIALGVAFFTTIIHNFNCYNTAEATVQYSIFNNWIQSIWIETITKSLKMFVIWSYYLFNCCNKFFAEAFFVVHKIKSNTHTGGRHCLFRR